MPFYFITMHLFNPQAQLLFPAVSLQSHNTEQKKKKCLSLVFFSTSHLWRHFLSVRSTFLFPLWQRQWYYTQLLQQCAKWTHTASLCFFFLSLSLSLSYRESAVSNQPERGTASRCKKSLPLYKGQSL